MTASSEGREYTRIDVKIDVVCSQGGQEDVSGWTQGVTIKGLFVHCDTTYALNENCTIKILIGGEDSGVFVQAKARVSFLNEEGMALEILSHLSLDSFEHLRNLVLANADQVADQVEQEITTHQNTIRQDAATFPVLEAE